MVLGTTLGMLLANVPVVFVGDALIRRVPLKWVRIVAALSFVALGVYVLASRLRLAALSIIDSGWTRAPADAQRSTAGARR